MPQLGLFQLIARGGERFRLKERRIAQNGLMSGTIEPIGPDTAVAQVDSACRKVLKLIERATALLRQRRIDYLISPTRAKLGKWLSFGSGQLIPGFEDQLVAAADLDAAMEAVRRLASLARSAREERNIRVRQPLGRMQVAVPGSVRGTTLEELLELLRLEVNVKKIEVVASDTERVLHALLRPGDEAVQ